MTVSPKNATVYDGLAWVQATCPGGRYRNGKEALENASKAFELDEGKYWGAMATLACSSGSRGTGA